MLVAGAQHRIIIIYRTFQKLSPQNGIGRFENVSTFKS